MFFFIIVFISACSSAVKPVFSVMAEPGFDGYYIQNSENVFFPLEKIVRIGFKENVKNKQVTYKFCETYNKIEFLKVTKVKLADYRLNVIKGDGGRSVGNNYSLYKVVESELLNNGLTIKLCAQEVKSKLAIQGATIKLKPELPLMKGLYYLKDTKWFINDKSRYFILD